MNVYFKALTILVAAIVFGPPLIVIWTVLVFKLVKFWAGVLFGLKR